MDRSFETDQTILFFGNPRIPYSCEVIDQAGGYACLFTRDFLHLGERSKSILQSPLFKIGGTPVLRLTPEQKVAAETIFQKMIAEQETDYAFKDELTRNYIHLPVNTTLAKSGTLVVKAGIHIRMATRSSLQRRLCQTRRQMAHRQSTFAWRDVQPLGQ